MSGNHENFVLSQFNELPGCLSPDKFSKKLYLFCFQMCPEIYISPQTIQKLTIHKN